MSESALPPSCSPSSPSLSLPVPSSRPPLSPPQSSPSFPSPAASFPVCSGGPYSHVLPASLQSGFNFNSNLVAFSSRMIAAERALEALRPPQDRLFEDPVAEILAGPEAMARVKARMAAAVEKERSLTASGSAASRDSEDNDMVNRPRIAIRTRYFDDSIHKVAEENPSALQQLVILGAGMDSRAFRLSCLTRCSCTVFELDQAVVLNVKTKTLAEMENPIQPLCQRHSVPVDLTSSQLPDSQSFSPPSFSSSPVVPLSPWTIQLCSDPYSFKRDTPSTWLIEGLLFYLSEDQQLKVLHDISFLSAPGSVITLSHINERTLHNATQNSTYSGSLLRMWKSCFSDEFRRQMELFGWEISRLHQLGGEEANYGRWKAPVYPMEDKEHGKVLYVTAVKKHAWNPAITAAQLQPPESAVVSASPHSDGRKRARDAEAESSIEHQKRMINEALQQAGARIAPSPFHSEIANYTVELRKQDYSLSHELLSMLTYQFSLYSQLARRLVDSIPISEQRDSAALRVIDASATFGLQSSVLLQQFPKAMIYMIEPDTELLEKAKQSVPKEAQLSASAIPLSQISTISSTPNFTPVDAILCNIAMEDCDESVVLLQAAALLRPSGVFCYNLWPSAFELTQANFATIRESCVQTINAALTELQLPLITADTMHSGTPSTPSRSRDYLHSCARSAGLTVDFCVLDVDEVTVDLLILREATKASFLPTVSDPELRKRVIHRAREIGQSQRVKLHTERVRLLKPQSN